MENASGSFNTLKFKTRRQLTRKYNSTGKTYNDLLFENSINLFRPITENLQKNEIIFNKLAHVEDYQLP